MPSIHSSAAEALRDETRALMAEARATMAHSRRIREQKAGAAGSKARAAETRPSQNFATLKAHSHRIRGGIEDHQRTSQRAQRSAPNHQPPSVVRPDANIGEPLTAAAALLEIGAPEEAWEALDRLDAEQQASAEVLAMRAKVFRALDMPGMAELVTFAIQAGSPEWAHRHFLAAQALARLGLGDRAKELAQVACALQPDLKSDLLECAELASLLHAASP